MKFSTSIQKGLYLLVQKYEIVNVPGCSLWATYQGKGPSLVCCHGGPGLWDYLGPVAVMIDDLVTVYRFDQRACGRSTGNPDYDIVTAVADLEALRDHWNLPQWIILGHSWGATLGLAYCLAHPSRVQALIYLSGTGFDDSWKEEYHRNRDALLIPSEKHRLAELRTQLSIVQEVEYDAVEREYCELSWSTDIADRSQARKLARQLFVMVCISISRLIRFLEKMSIVLLSNQTLLNSLPPCRYLRWLFMEHSILALPECLDTLLNAYHLQAMWNFPV
jgi:pimeloyl-ACP methyl ester carboxylesterase